jgi:hypothetical protein
MYVAGTGTGTLPTLYSVGFNGTGVMNTNADASAVLAAGTADSSAVTEFLQHIAPEGLHFRWGGADHCIATTGGGTAGCVMGLDITGGFPIVSAATPALRAPEAQGASSWITTAV